MSDIEPIKANFEIKDETVRTVVDAALDVLSGPTELFGWLGDAVRVHRARSALRCFQRTKEIASKAGLDLVAPPVKFIAQYVEYASLEDDQDDNLIEWWARVLVDAGSNYQEKHVFFANVLRQVSALELEILETIVRNGRRSYKIALASEAEFVHDFQFNDDDLTLHSEVDDEKAQAAIHSIVSVFEIPGVLALDVFVDDPESNQWQEWHPDYNDHELASWQILQSLQLVRIDYKKFQKGDVHYRVRVAMLTQLGAEFYFSCHDKDLPEQMSDDVRYKRKLLTTEEDARKRGRPFSNKGV